MKRIHKILTFASLLIATATFSANAQTYYGVKAGANVASVGALDSENATSGYGYQIGIVAGTKIPIASIGVEAEALWVNNKFDTKEFGKINSSSFEIPVMASIPIIPILPISVKVGPTFMLLSEATTEKGLKLDPIKADVGYTIGLDLRLSKITFDLRYNGQFTSSTPFKSLGDKLIQEKSKYSLRTGTVSATIGYRF